MRAFSRTQPWAQLLAVGALQIDARPMGTSYRGPIAFHASKSFPAYGRRFAEDQPCFRLLQAVADRWTRKHLPWNLPLNAIVGFGRLVNVFPIVGADVDPGLELSIGNSRVIVPVPSRDRALAKFVAGRYAWVFDNIRTCDPPIPAEGQRGIWHWHPRADLLPLTHPAFYPPRLLLGSPGPGPCVVVPGVA